MDTTPRVTPRLDGQSSIGDEKRYWGNGYFYHLNLKGDLNNRAIDTGGDIYCRKIFVDGVPTTDSSGVQDRDVGRFNGTLTGRFRGIDLDSPSFIGDLDGNATSAGMLKNGIMLGIGSSDSNTAYGRPVLIRGIPDAVEKLSIDLEYVDARIIRGQIPESILPSSVFTTIVNVNTESDMYSLTLKEQNSYGDFSERSVQKGDTVNIRYPYEKITYMGDYEDGTKGQDTITLYYAKDGNTIRYWEFVSEKTTNGGTDKVSVSGYLSLDIPDSDDVYKSNSYYYSNAFLNKLRINTFDWNDSNVAKSTVYGDNMFIVGESKYILTAEEKGLVDYAYTKKYSVIKTAFDTYCKTMLGIKDVDGAKNAKDALFAELGKIELDADPEIKIVTGFDFEKSTINASTNCYTVTEKNNNIFSGEWSNDLKPTVYLSMTNEQTYKNHTDSDGNPVELAVVNVKNNQLTANILVARKIETEDWKIVTNINGLEVTLDTSDFKTNNDPEVLVFTEYTTEGATQKTQSQWSDIQKAYKQYTTGKVSWNDILNKPTQIRNSGINDVYSIGEVNDKFLSKLDIETTTGKALLTTSSDGIKQSSKSIGNENNPVYVKGGVVTSFSTTYGEPTKPVYFKDGVITKCSGEVWTRSQIEQIAEETVKGVPVGTVIMSLQSTAPKGFLKCDGKAYSSGTYAELYKIIGTNFGNSGVGTFRVPNYAGIYPRCVGEDSLSIWKRQEEALPNIYGICGTSWMSNTKVSLKALEDEGKAQITGAFAKANVTYTGYGVNDASTSRNDPIVDFDASRSSKVYKAGWTHVTPSNYAFYFYIKY